MKIPFLLVRIQCVHVRSPLFLHHFAVQTERVVCVKSQDSLVGFDLLGRRHRLLVGRRQPLLPVPPLKLFLAQLPAGEPVGK